MDPVLLLVFRVCLCNTVLYVPGSLVVACWKGAGLLVLLCVMVSRVFASFPYGVLGQAWYLIVWVTDLCLLSFSRKYIRIKQDKGLKPVIFSW